MKYALAACLALLTLSGSAYSQASCTCTGGTPLTVTSGTYSYAGHDVKVQASTLTGNVTIIAASIEVCGDITWSGSPGGTAPSLTLESTGDVVFCGSSGGNVLLSGIAGDGGAHGQAFNLVFVSGTTPPCVTPPTAATDGVAGGVGGGGGSLSIDAGGSVHFNNAAIQLNGAPGGNGGDAGPGLDNVGPPYDITAAESAGAGGNGGSGGTITVLAGGDVTFHGGSLQVYGGTGGFGGVGKSGNPCAEGAQAGNGGSGGDITISADNVTATAVLNVAMYGGESGLGKSGGDGIVGSCSGAGCSGASALPGQQGARGGLGGIGGSAGTFEVTAGNGSIGFGGNSTQAFLVVAGEGGDARDSGTTGHGGLTASCGCKPVWCSKSLTPLSGRQAQDGGNGGSVVLTATGSVNIAYAAFYLSGGDGGVGGAGGIRQNGTCTISTTTGACYQSGGPSGAGGDGGNGGTGGVIDINGATATVTGASVYICGGNAGAGGASGVNGEGGLVPDPGDDGFAGANGDYDTAGVGTVTGSPTVDCP